MDLQIDCPLRLDKLILLVTGREVANPSVPVWANGNFMLSRSETFKIFCENLTAGG